MAAWKTIRISKPCTLRVKSGNLLIEEGEMRVRLSLEDTDSIVFEGDRFMISAKVMAALSRHKVAVLFCDESYMPTAILHPFHQSSLATETLRLQLQMENGFKERLWAKIVRTKILLQAQVLERFGNGALKLETYAGQVRSGDPYGAEAKSARVYWLGLFENLHREQESLDVRNQALNYAYALVRSMMVRDLSVAGFLPALGLWHDNRYNAFNLADDLMEPFRPVVDAAVYLLLSQYKEDRLTPDFKRAIIAVFDDEYLIYDKGLSTIRTVCKRYVLNFKSAVGEKNIDRFLMPEIDFERLYECV